MKGLSWDHAAKWETSILWALRPDLVDMSLLSRNLEESLEGLSARTRGFHALRELGEEVVNHIVSRISDVAVRLLSATGPLNRERYLRA
ncbi:MAG: hypothetical protein QXV23_03615 [Candidatus Bathyarchaeia archaeon]